MKRKFFSAMLLFALTLGATSTFVSCKDYDDDISGLRDEISKLATQDELNSRISDMQAAITTAQSEAEAKAAAAQAVAEAAQEAAAKAQSSADAAQSAADAAQAVADAAKAQAEALEANGATKAEVEAALAAAAQAQATADAAKADAAAAIAEVREEIEAAKAEALAAAEEAKTAAENAQTTANEAVAGLAELAEKCATKDEVDAVRTTAEAALAAANQAASDLATLQATLTAELADLRANSATKEELASAKAELEEKIEAAKTELDSKIAAANTAIEALSTLVQENADKIADNEEAIAANKAAAEEAKTAAENAMAKATEGVQAAAAAQAKADSIATVLASVKSTADAAAASIITIEADIANMKTQLSSLDSRLSAVEAKLALINIDEAGGATVDLSEIESALDELEAKLESIIGEYSTMVTSVSLFTSELSGYTTTAPEIKFVQVEEEENTFPSSSNVADSTLTFKEGNIRTYSSEPIIIRVSPTTAILNPDNISLINSKGEELSDLVYCSKVEEYNTLLTRTGSNNGLWKVTFSLKENYDPDAFEDAVTSGSKDVLFAVAIKNTSLNEDERRVISGYDVTVSASNAGVVANSFKVEGNEGWKDITAIHNRYTATENGTSTTGIAELSWIDDTKPATTAITSGSNANAVNRPTPAVDDRQSEVCLPVSVNTDINIEFADEEVAGFYVTLDDQFAIESGNSEINAWNSYEYENVGKAGSPAKLFTGNSGSIQIKSSNTINDIIGFRVYAVNLNGTLLDPDGRAFYVVVGNVSTVGSVKGNVLASTATNSSSDFISVSGLMPTGFTNIEGWTASSSNTSVNGASTEFTVKYYDEDKNEISQLTTSNASDVAYVKFVMPNAADYVDGGTYSQTLNFYYVSSGVKTLVKTVTATMTKVMPTTFPANLQFLPAQNYDTYAFRPYMVPENGYGVSVTSANGTKDLNDIFYGLDANLQFTFAQSQTVNNKKTDLDVISPYVLTVGKDFIDNSARTMTASYLYRGISSYKKSNTWYVGEDYPVDYGTSYTVNFACWHHAASYSWVVYDGNFAHNYVDYSNNELQWSADGTTKTIPYTEIKVANTYNSSEFGGTLAKLVSDKQYLTVSEPVLTVDGMTNPYFTPSIDGTAGIKFTQDETQADQAPLSDHTETLTFKVTDSYGHTSTISLDIVILKPVTD
ncbi:MAG: hypothetical protein Q4D41_03075 [Prevotellaceae bacterium]|nr:hypothetical protein [Prevotellaceae bacterium]